MRLSFLGIHNDRGSQKKSESSHGGILRSALAAGQALMRKGAMIFIKGKLFATPSPKVISIFLELSILFLQ